MSNRSKSKREAKAAAALERRAEVASRKREQRERLRTKHSQPVTLRERLWATLDGAWYVLGGPLVWIFRRGPIFRNRRQKGSQSGA